VSSSDPIAGSITMAFAELRTGGKQGVSQLWQRFFPRLLALARKNLVGRPQKMADADDAVQSAFMSFYARAVAGEFGDLLRRDDLWSLLGVITARKALKQARHERAAKRGGGKLVDQAALEGDDGDRLKLEELAAQLPTHDVDLSCQELIESLEEPLRPYAVLRLLGYLNREIAVEMDCTERKVERKLQIIRMKWENQL
jgi:DNA-directed RNA polymerase specialized sigma24 family protein